MGHVPKRVWPEALMHDASEAYLGDIPAPIKKGLPDYRKLEERVQRDIAKRFDLQYPWPNCVNVADRRMVMTEGLWFGKNINAWGIRAKPYEGMLYAPQTVQEVVNVFRFWAALHGWGGVSLENAYERVMASAKVRE
jgi:hypothetical protein